ncbi:MAG: cytochrome c3 family protein [Candidatus Omnitrophota bacterium]
MNPFTFPKWLDRIRPALGLTLAAAPLYLLFVAYYGGSPRTTDVGYQPEQPLAYSHALHAGDLGIDCRYCHNTVETTARAALPSTQTCMNCHTKIKAESPKLALVRESVETGMPLAWVRVHDLPDYAYFNHSAHVRRGVSCVSCHGRVDKMEVVSQVNTLSMGWCLDCHRQPDKYLREPDMVTVMDYVPQEDQLIVGKRIREKYNLNPSTDCSTCHR